MTAPKRKPILCLDFDGVLHSYTSGWCGPSTIPDPPVDGAMAFLWLAVRAFDVHVYSSRSGQPGGIQAMREWIERHMDKHVGENTERITRLIKFPTEKPPAMVTIDDRALTFTGTFPAISELMAFKPWNKKD